MKVIMYLAITPNGMIARENGDESWVSPEDWERFAAKAHEVGNFIIGRTSYEIIKKTGEIARFTDVRIVVVTSDKNYKTAAAKHTAVNSPKDAVRLLEKEKCAEALIAGGAKLNGACMQEKLVDEILLDIQPIVFGKGIPLFGDADFEAKLKLLETKKISKNESQLHYRVLR
jgi:dihydrofolate reductase